MAEGMQEGIDFVLTWVDGSDPKWLRDKEETFRKYGAAYPQDPGSVGVARYRDWGLLKYWFRAVETYAPWVRKIHLVTCGQTPPFLDVRHEKIHQVFHEDIMRKEDLPTFNARAIELNLHRIEGLSERFVYFNDDMFLTGPVTPEDFFQDGLPKDSGLFFPISENSEVFTRMVANALAVINRHFSFKDCLRAHPEKYFSKVYGEYLKLNLKASSWLSFQGFLNAHTAYSCLKSTYEEIWEKETQYLSECSAYRFRTPDATMPWLISYWQIASGRFIPRNPDFSMYMIASETDKARKAFHEGRHKVVCLNDVSYIMDYEKCKNELQEILEEVLPLKSSYEKD